MTLLTDALRRIASESPPVAHAVAPLSDDERTLAERIVANSARPIVEPPRAVAREFVSTVRLDEWTRATAPVEIPPDNDMLLYDQPQPLPEPAGRSEVDDSVAEAQSVTGSPVAGSPHAGPPTEKQRSRVLCIQSALSEAFGIRTARDRCGEMQDPARRASEGTTEGTTINTLACASGSICAAGKESAADDRPAAVLSRRLTNEFAGKTGGRVLAFVLVDADESGDAARLNQLLKQTAESLFEAGAGEALVINAASHLDSDRKTVVAGSARNVRSTVRNVIRHPVALDDVLAMTTTDASVRTLDRPAPIGQSEETLAQIVTFMDACRRDHAWTLVAVVAADLAELAAFVERCDGVQVVVEAGRTDRRAAREVVRQLRHFGARVSGGVMLERESTFRAAA